MSLNNLISKQFNSLKEIMLSFKDRDRDVCASSGRLYEYIFRFVSFLFLKNSYTIYLCVCVYRWETTSDRERAGGKMFYIWSAP